MRNAAWCLASISLRPAGTNLERDSSPFTTKLGS